ncbi:hypothetical protein [Bacillus toyonensis]|uniref:hypothetical protein n=1 Tax=Bacillus toyonensis TaxID=155322 RepID=UPI001155812C|nr:hypothetical protein [Bacillus toyonensis]MCU5181340.1 hypothetical protein [Bacillus toyonensis]MRC15539.1 hypothetical protein [Bacillus thuringiensis]
MQRRSAKSERNKMNDKKRGDKMAKINTKTTEAARETTQRRSGMVMSRHIQPEGNTETKKAAPIVIHGRAMARHLNSN